MAWWMPTRSRPGIGRSARGGGARPRAPAPWGRGTRAARALPPQSRPRAPRAVPRPCRPQTRGTGTDDRNGLARQHLRRHRPYPILLEGVVDDLDLDLLDRHRVLIDAQHARRLARRGAQPAGELREVVGGVQPVGGVAPAVGAHQVVPLGDQVTERTTVVTERDSAVHAARRLNTQRGMVEVVVYLSPVEDAQRNRPPLGQLSLAMLQEPSGISHAPRP